MRNLKQWFSGAVMAALVQFLPGLGVFTSANGAPERAFEPQSGPTLAISDVSSNEGNSGTTDVLVAVTLTNPNGQTVTVNYQVVDGTATRGSDYTVISTSGTMTFFNGGATTQRIRVMINGDATNEPDETFFINLSNATNATLTDNQAVGTIVNDDGGGGSTLAISDVSANEGNAGTTDVMVPVTLTNPNGQTVTVDYQVVDGTATRGSDYTVISTSGTMTFFNGGATTQRIRLTISGDTGDEPDETILVNLSNATNATLSDNLGVATISNDDGGTVVPPSNLTATATGTSTAALAWTDNSSDEDGFKIERKTGTGAFGEVATVNSNSTSFHDAGLTACTTYLYRVRAFKGTANSIYSNEATATTTGCPTLAIGDVSSNEGNSGTTDVLVPVTLTNPNGQTVTVDYQVADGTATRGSDYTVISTSGTMTFFNGGATTQRIRLTIIGDADDEPDETVLVNLSNATNATLSDNQGVATISNDAGGTVVLPPSNLTATATGTSTAALAWTDNSSNEDGFKIERKISGGSFSEVGTVGSNVNSFPDNGLSDGTTYVYRVRAFKGALNSDYSNEASVTTPLNPPSNLNAITTSPSTASLVWTDNSSNEDGFKIERKISGGSFSEIATVGSNVNFFENTGLSDGTTYVYRVRAFKGALNSDYSNEASVTTQLNPPSNLSATATGATTVLLTWTDNSNNETGFKIERKLNGGTFSEIATTASNVNSFNNTGLSVGATYVYRIRACNDTGCSGYSNEAPVTIPTIIPPSNLIATTTGTSTIVLTWTDNSINETGFKIERKTGSDPFSEIGTAAGNVNSFNDSGLNPGTAYVYRVRAFNATLNSSYSNEATAATLLIAPSNLVATATGTTTALLTWTDNSNNESGFKIERKTGSDPFSEIGTTAGNVNSFNDSGLNPGTTYVYRVRAFNGVAHSNYSNEASTMPTPIAPSNLIATATETSTIVLTWTDNSNNETGFKIERKTGSGSFSEIGTAPSNGNSFNDTGLSAGTAYVYRVRAFNATLNSSYSNEATAATLLIAPSNLVATATGATTALLTWTDNSNNETGFKIERKTGSDNFSEIGTAGSNVTSFNDTGLSPGTAYVYRVRAFNGVAHSNYSNEAPVTTPPIGTANLALNKPIAASSATATRPATNAVDGSTNTYWRSGSVTPPTWLRVDLGAAMVVGRVVVKWRENYYAKNYEAQVSNDDGNWTTVSTATGAAGAQTLNFSPRTARYVRLNFLVNQKSNYRVEEFEVYSGAVTKSHELAAAEMTVPEKFALEQNYPNPFPANGIFDNPSTRIGFRLPQAEHVTIKVYSVNGAEVKTLVNEQYPAGAHSVVFAPQHLPSGTYFYVMQAGAVRQVRQLLLVK